MILSGCHGCSFIKERVAKDGAKDTTEQTTEQTEQPPERKVDPIPINPKHS